MDVKELVAPFEGVRYFVYRGASYASDIDSII